MLFWITVWGVSFLLFILIPLLCAPDNRRCLYYRVTLLKWNVEAEVAQANAADAAAAAAAAALARSNNDNSIPAPAAHGADGDSDRNFHYVLSRAQEDEIRESFLTKRLQKYTFTLSPTSIQRLRSDTTATATSSTSVDSGGDAAVEPNDSSSHSPYGDENDDADLEAAAASKFQPPPNDSSPRNESNKETTATEDCCSSDDGLSDDGLLLEMDEVFDDSSMIILPNLSSGGKDSGNNTNSTVRQVPNGCAICLTSMDVNDRIVFSSDPKCNHIFHEQCMMDWLVASGRKFLKQQRREERNSSGAAAATTTLYRYNCQNPIEKILSFPMLCPCCRQPFVRIVDEEGDDDSDGDDSLAKPPTATASTVTEQPVATSNDPAAESVEDVESPPVQDTADDDDVRGSQRASIANDEPSPSTIAVGSDDEYY